VIGDEGRWPPWRRLALHRASGGRLPRRLCSRRLCSRRLCSLPPAVLLRWWPSRIRELPIISKKISKKISQKRRQTQSRRRHRPWTGLWLWLWLWLLPLIGPRLVLIRPRLLIEVRIKIALFGPVGGVGRGVVDVFVGHQSITAPGMP
jgi:hypothetical protein